MQFPFAIFAMAPNFKKKLRMIGVSQRRKSKNVLKLHHRYAGEEHNSVSYFWVEFSGELTTFPLPFARPLPFHGSEKKCSSLSFSNSCILVSPSISTRRLVSHNPIFNLSGLFIHVFIVLFRSSLNRIV